MRHTLLAILCSFAAIAGAARAADAESVPAPDLLQGDGRVSAFYTWTGTIPPKPGTLLRSEPLPAVLGLPEASEQRRILYTSTDGAGGKLPVVVSGALFLPKGTPPPGGWPLVAWAHGTVGVADICAPSWAKRSYRDIAYLDAWLDQGYAVVATDYQGLGTPGGHPYLNVRVEAYSVLDSIRAALAYEKRIANKIAIVGQSQGGGAAVGTAAYAPQYAPELNVRGTVATGVPYFGPNVPSAGIADYNKVDPGIAYRFYIVLMAQQTDPSLKASDVFQAAALPLFEVARSACIYSLEDDIVLERLTGATAYLPAIRAVLANQFPKFMFPTLALKQPLFVATGALDQDVNPAVQEALVKDACAAGATVEAHLYAGLAHSQTVNASLNDSIPFVKRIFAGQPIQPVCSPAPQ
jgi:pimeloyl-ACP methyl ester carboxylesterase